MPMVVTLFKKIRASPLTAGDGECGREENEQRQPVSEKPIIIDMKIVMRIADTPEAASK